MFASVSMDEYEGFKDERSDEEEDFEASSDIDDEERMVINPTSVRDRIDVISFCFFLKTSNMIYVL